MEIQNKNMLSEAIKNGHHLEAGFSEEEIAEARELSIPRECFEIAQSFANMIDSKMFDDNTKMDITHSWEEMMKTEPRFAIALDEIEDPLHVSVEKRLAYMKSHTGFAVEKI